MQLTSSKVTTTAGPYGRQRADRTSVSSLFLLLQCCCVATSPLCDTSGLLENWLRLIRDVYRTYKDHLDQIEVTLLCWMLRMLMIKLSTNLYHRMRRCATSNWWN